MTADGEKVFGELEKLLSIVMGNHESITTRLLQLRERVQRNSAWLLDLEKRITGLERRHDAD